MLNYAANLSRNATLMPNKIALCFGDTNISYAQLDAATSQVANGLAALGIGKGDKVVLSCPNLPYFPIIYYGILKLGAVVVPINVLLKAREVAYHLQDCDAKAFLCFEGTAELAMGKEGWEGFQQAKSCAHFVMITADPAKPSPIEGCNTLGVLMKDRSPLFNIELTDANDTAVILYTSGTTGTPKGAELTHSNIMMNIQICQNLMKLDSRDTQLLVLPLFHTFGQTVQMNAVIAAGATMVLLARFDPDAALAAMEKHKVTIFAGVPTMYIALLNLPGAADKHDLKAIASHLRLGLSGGAALPVEVIRRFEEKFGIKILEGYGLSETSPVATFSHMDFQSIAGSVGQPVVGVEVRVVNENDEPLPVGEAGEIVVRGHNVMKGYYKRPEATAEAIRNGWFHTGDIGKTDEHGNFYIVDRLKDMIIRGGFNVYPRELEEVLMTHPALAQVAVIGVPHESHGEEIKAVVVLKPGMQATPEELVAWSKEKMAAYKYPRMVEVVAALPMTATGKILKRALKAE
ncbi:long-chain fatty acid--CoA ligase [Undibacterium sp.]|jgi:long-chain acyl-CoA synthetase|uniref:long-chain-fatty-acid--CoA ligase n=1 Tax=Undibacterium sp. TaxID=1914977 RepID=UPI002C97BAF9|nr:long-chain fatty acid--CoA ligase [Undibacterium sp.]HTD03438.1 long-chain fatty acid--CoA ligase [Undibacterium sp.]